ncbi:amidohydrolase family protein [Cellulophaga sp. HaHaR_3_176]|uniref:amidohydrolase family protein n=1 Tax=Cellulophaga sp. HaHaR_3_176 TaxID=1942464 RepID=UPI001C1F57CD|nr:amidohydrolase family protein [Cellulophaga sp. HaHaR_3_176]QWX83555.1 amidohydrolase family protein [Cellulophaga sp. HaHaR_3_176]
MIVNNKSKLMMNKASYMLQIVVLLLVTGCSTGPSKWQNINEEGTFLVYRRQSLIGEETYSIKATKDSILVTSLQGENERGRITGVAAELHLDMNLEPSYYLNRRITSKDTIVNLEVRRTKDSVSVWEKNRNFVQFKNTEFFPVHSNIPAGIEMMLYHYYFKNGGEIGIPTLPRGEVTMNFIQKDTVVIKEKKVPLDRYVVEGINWGGRTIWVDESQNLIALVKANTQIREYIRKGYEEAKPFFVKGNVEQQMAALNKYTNDLKGAQAGIKALVGADLVDGVSDTTQEDMTLIIENGRIKTIGKRTEVSIPEGAKVINLKGKTLMPGMWDMHAHSNQVQWAPAYLAGGVTTIRDNGNELEFATSFRDAIAKKGALGPDILLAGMTDGAGIQGNGVVRARTVQEAQEVADLYFSNGYKQIKIYSSVNAELTKVLAEEGHKRGMSITGHVPNAIGNARGAIDAGMDMLSHRSRILTVLFPDKKVKELGSYYIEGNDISQEQIDESIAYLLEHKTVLDPTIALDVVRAMPRGSVIEAVEPFADRIAYELFEGKRFRSGLPLERSEKAKADYIKAMGILGQFYKAGVPIVAGTDNIVPVFGLYLEIETYQKYGELTPLQAIQSATSVPAKAMGLYAETGSLEVGKEADIAILEENPLKDIKNIRTVEAVITNGNYYESEPLWHAADFKAKNDN